MEKAMDLINWTPDLAVGHDKIDDQHRQLFKAANALAEAMWDGKGAEEVRKTVEFMAEYAVFHFKDEEDVMLKNSYPGYAAQKQAHEKFLKDVSDLKTRFESTEVSSALAIEVLTNACNWFRDHIRQMDKPLGDFLQQGK
jgi:hemerythrin-like metal-binding protein